MPHPPYPDFSPRAPWLGADLQTLRNMIRGPALPSFAADEYTSFTIALSDGSGDQLTARLCTPATGDLLPDAPLVVLVHGLGGSEESSYIQVTARHLCAQGYPVVQLSLRGAGPSRPLCRSQYHAGRTADFQDVVTALYDQGPTAGHAHRGIVAVGYSLGGNMLLKFAAEYGGLRGVASVSAPIDLATASHRILEARNYIYHAYLLGRIKSEALASPGGLSHEERACIPGLKTILEFDDAFVAPHNGFTDAADYYAQNSALQFLGGIDTPSLILHACDDPWIPIQTYHDFPWQTNPKLMPLFARSGGHVGFHAAGSRVPWHDQCLSTFLEHV